MTAPFKVFSVAVVFMSSALVLQLWMMRRVSRAGGRLIWFTVGPDMFKWLRDYRSLAQARQWPVWPTSMFWILFAIGMALVIFAGLMLK